MNQIKDNKVIMKIKNLISVILLSGGIMGTDCTRAITIKKSAAGLIYRNHIVPLRLMVSLDSATERMYCEKMVIQPEPPVPALMP